jgi:hypothetical protein
MILIKVAYFILSAICLVLIARGLRFGLDRCGLSPEKKKNFLQRFYLIVGIWIALISLLAISGFLADFDSFPPRVTITLIPPMILMLFFTIRSQSLKTILAAIPVQWLLYLQSFRVIVELMLWYQYDLGMTPIQMTFEGRNMDIIAGITGPVVGYLYAKRGAGMKKLVIAWNFIGLGLLLNILAVAVLSFPTKFRYFMNEPANYIITEFPFVWLPGILVAVAYSLHFLSLKQVLSRP